MAGGEGLSGASAAISANAIFKRCQRMEQTGGRHPLAHGGIEVGLQRFDHGIEVRV